MDLGRRPEDRRQGKETRPVCTPQVCLGQKSLQCLLPLVRNQSKLDCGAKLCVLNTQLTVFVVITQEHPFSCFLYANEKIQTLFLFLRLLKCGSGVSVDCSLLNSGKTATGNWYEGHHLIIIVLILEVLQIRFLIKIFSACVCKGGGFFVSETPFKVIL